MASLRFGPPGLVAPTARIPGDKSISHRALLLSSCALGTTAIEGLNRGGDTLATLRALRALGIAVDDDGSTVRVTGGDFAAGAGTIDCGNSGTTMRLLMGMLAGRTSCTLDGDASLRHRPMERVAAPLRSMGAEIESAAGGVPPVNMRLGGALRAIDYALPVASAQVKSAILLAGLRASGVTTVRSPHASRDHTERMLAAMGVSVQVDGLTTSVQPATLRAIEFLEVPGDPSAAVFFLIAAAAMPRANILVREVCVNPTRTGAFDVMRSMGARLQVGPESFRHAEPIASLSIEGGTKLHSVEIFPEMVPSLIDEIPALCALASLAEGEFIVRGAAELRVKESDRIAATVRMLHAFGADAIETDDGLIVRGGSTLHPPAAIDTNGDHRIGMSAAALAAAIGAPVEIQDSACIGTSFPDFAAHWSAAFGLTVL